MCSNSAIKVPDGDPFNMNKQTPNKIKWVEPDGTPISCEEKLKVLNENLEELQQYYQDALEDAVLMGCDETRVREIFRAALNNVKNPYKKADG